MRRLLGDAPGQLGRAEDLAERLAALGRRRRLRGGEGRAHQAHEIGEAGGVGRAALQAEREGRHQRREGPLRLLLREAELARHRIHSDPALGGAHHIKDIEQRPLPRGQAPTIRHDRRGINALAALEIPRGLGGSGAGALVLADDVPGLGA
jgi:hypothetical protein